MASSFVADPFLFIPSNHALLRGEDQKPRGMLGASRPRSAAMWSYPSNPRCDLSRAAPVAGAMPGAESGTVGCYNPLAFPLAPSARFIPPAPLSGPREVPPPSDPWYLFFELKSLETGRGEIGAAVSFDQGAKWSNMGTVLREHYKPAGKSEEEVLHLSYPLVLLSEASECTDVSAGAASEKDATASTPGSCLPRTEFLMIPETNLLSEIRIYRTDRCCFPFGWTLAAVKLRGDRFVDTSVVWSAEEGRWFIFTSVEYEARLYMTDGPHARSLVDAPWVLHPASPLYARGSRHFGRNAGRIVPYLGGGFLRPSQDCSAFYGEQVHLHHITRLTSREFREEWLRSIKPSATGPSAAWSHRGRQGMLGRSQAGQVDANYFSSRLHHFDAHYIPAHKRPKEGATKAAMKAAVAGAKDAETAAVTDAATEAETAEEEEIPARWVLVLDGDNLPDDYQFWEREGWFNHAKSLLLLLALGFTAVTLVRNGFAEKICVHPLRLLWARRIGAMHSIKSFGFQARLWLYKILLPPEQVASPSSAMIAFAFFKRGSQLSAVCLAALAVSLWITARYPFSMSGPAGAHSGYALDLPRAGFGYESLARSSAAYAEAFGWTAGLAAEFGFSVDSTPLPERSIPLSQAAEPVGGVPTLHKPDRGALSYEGRVLFSAAAAGPATDAQCFAPPLAVGQDASSSSIFQAFRALREKDSHWAEDLVMPRPSTPGGLGAPPVLTTPSRLAPRLMVVTAATALQFPALKNLLASLQFWHHVAPRGRHWSNGRPRPAYEITVVDLGLTEDQREEIRCARYVTLKPWSAGEAAATKVGDEPPNRTRQLALAVGGWHPLLISEMLSSPSLQDGDALLWIAPEMEVRGSLADLTATLFRRGIFAAALPGQDAALLAAAYGSGRVQVDQADRSAGSHSIGAQTSPDMLKTLGVPVNSLSEAPLCSAGSVGVLGLVKSSASPSEGSAESSAAASVSLVDGIVAAAVACASNIDCIFPPQALSSRHAFDTSLWSALLAQAGVPCSASMAFTHFAPPSALNSDPTLPSLIPALAPAGDSNRARRSMEGASVVFGYRGVASASTAGAWPYAAKLLEDRDEKGQCVPSADGWIAPPLPASDVKPQGIVPALLPSFLGPEYESLDSFVSELPAARKKFLECARSFRPCDSEQSSLVNLLAKLEKAVLSGAAAQPSLVEAFRSTLAARATTPAFWFFFLLTCAMIVWTSARKALFRSRMGLCLAVSAVLFVFIWLPLYQRALNRWGTFAPWNALIYTSPYRRSEMPANNPELVANVASIDLGVDSLRSFDPAAVIAREAWKLPFPTAATAGSIAGKAVDQTSWHAPTAAELFAGPPPGWRPPHRVVVSFTTMPHHVDKLGDTIDSLLAQTMLPDAIYLNLPLGVNRRTNQSYEILPYLSERYGIDGKKTPFKILRCEDVGPLTKLVPTLLEEPDPETMVITVDSDKIYDPLTVSTLVWRSFHDPRAAFGLCGWSFFWQPPPMEVVPVYIPWSLRLQAGRSVDVLQACCGNIYRRGHFPDMDLLRNPHRKCFTTDDLWIAAYLGLRSRIQRVLIDTPGALRRAKDAEA